MIRPIHMAALAAVAAGVVALITVAAPSESDSSRTSATTSTAATTSPATAPSQGSRYCLRLSVANELLQTQQPGAPKLGNIMCLDDAAVATAKGLDGVVLFKLEGGDDGAGTWHFYGAGSDWAESPACREMPRPIALNLNGCFNK